MVIILQYCISIDSIGNTLLNIRNRFLLIPIVVTFMEQNGKIHTILGL